MTVTEESRHRLHQALDDAIGPEEATTLMEHLPPVGWADVATKQDLAAHREMTRSDLAHLQEVLEARFELVDARFEHIDGRFDQERAHVDARFEHIDARFERAYVEHRFDMIDQRFDLERVRADGQFGKVDEQFATLDERLRGMGLRQDDLMAAIGRLESGLTAQFWQFLSIIVVFGAILLGVLGFT